MASPASSDEGEIRDTSVGLEKANSSLLQLDGTSVDRPDRTRSSRSSESPSFDGDSTLRDRRSAERSFSSHERGPRGSKRSRHHDDHHDPRQFKVHYEDRASNRRRAHPSYKDLDDGSESFTNLRYDDRDWYPQKRHRTRSRSPYRAPREDGRRNRGDYDNGDRSQRNGYPESESLGSNGYEGRNGRTSIDQSVSKRADGPMPTDVSKRDAKSAQGTLQLHSNRSTNGVRFQEPVVTSDEKPEPPESQVLDETALIEQRRNRREAIKAKYKGSAPLMLVQALHVEAGSLPGSPGQNQSGQDDPQPTRSASPAFSTPRSPQGPPSPADFSISNDQDLANKVSDSNNASEEDGPSAADYDPTVDMREDRRRNDQRYVDEAPATDHNEKQVSLPQEVLLPTSAAPIQARPSKANDEFDMFADDDDEDMFAEEPSDNTAKTQDGGAGKELAVAIPMPKAKELDVGMLDNWDDSEGYYKVILGELLNGRYHVQSNLGRGVFSGVVRATDVTTKRLVAIKIIRNNDTMRKTAFKEIEILQKLNEADPDDKKHMIRLERHFDHKGHLCMVFENLSINLREVLKKFGRYVGLNLRAVRVYAQQMFLGLSLMRKCNILHGDLKPDNILVNETRNMLKICDLGSASDAAENEITPYLVSRFYRAPEIILGIPYDFAIDAWSVGCTLYELFTGKILFTGHTNNQMLRSIMDCRGKFTVKMLKRAQFAPMHFDEMANFRSVEQDNLTGKVMVKLLNFTKPSRDLRARLLKASKGMTDVEMKELNLFIDFLDRCLALNPEKRLSPAEALKHPFINRGGK